MKKEMDPEIRERLRRRGLPQTPMYEQAELRRMLQETQAQQRRVLEGVLGRGVPADQRRRVVNERMQQAFQSWLLFTCVRCRIVFMVTHCVQHC